MSEPSLRKISSRLPGAWTNFKWSFDVSVFYVFFGPVYIAYGLVVFIGTGFSCIDILNNGVKSFTGFLSDHSMARRIGVIMGFTLHLALLSYIARRLGFMAPPPMLFMHLWAVLWIVATIAPVILGEGDSDEVVDPAVIAAKLKSERLANIASSKNVAALVSGGDISGPTAIAGVLELAEGVFFGAKVRRVSEANSRSLYDLGVRGIIVNEDGIILLSTLDKDGNAAKIAEQLKEARDRHLYQALADQMGWSGGPRVAGWVIHLGGADKPKTQGFGVKFTGVDELVKAFRGVCDRHKAELFEAEKVAEASRSDRSKAG